MALGKCGLEVHEQLKKVVAQGPEGKVNELTDLHMLDKEVLGDIEKEIGEIMNKYANEKGVIDINKANKEVKEYLKAHVNDVKYGSARVISDVVKTNAIIQSVIDPKDFKGSFKRLLNLTEGDNSVETSFRVMNTRFKTNMISSLEKLGLYDTLTSGELDVQLRNISNRIDQGHDIASIKASKDISDDAFAVWEVVKKMNDDVHQQMVVAGLNVKHRADYLTSRNYSAEKILALGDKEIQAKKAFVKIMKEKYVDMKRTFGDSKDIESKADETLEQMFDSILGSQKDTLDNDLIGKSNHLTRLKKRKIAFKSGEIEHEFNQQFGNGKTVFEQLTSQMERGAKTIANVSRLGTRTEKVYNAVVDNFYTTFRGDKKVGDQKLGKALQRFQKSYNEVVVPMHTPTSFVKKTINMVRGLQAWTKLGSSVLAAFYDVNLSAFHYGIRTNGNQFKGMFEALKASVQVMSKEHRKEMARLMNVDTYFNDPAIIMGGHAGDYDSGFGKIGDAMNGLFMKSARLTGVPWQTEVSRTVNGVLQSKAFQSMLDNPNNLTNLQKIALDEFNISSKELEFLSKYAGKTEKIGATTSFDILDIDLDVIAKEFNTSQRGALKIQQDLFNKHASYIDSAVFKGTPTPTAKSKIQMGKHRDNQYADVFSLVMQFKETAWKIGLDNLHGFQKLHQAGGKKAVASGLSQYMALAIPSYLAFESMRAIINNKKTPFERIAEGEDMRDLMFDFVNKSSIAPLISDFADRATSSHFNSNPTQFLAGPTGSMIDDAFGVIKRRDSLDAAGRFTKRHLMPSNWIPFKFWDRNYGEYEMMTNRRIERN